MNCTAFYPLSNAKRYNPTSNGNRPIVYTYMALYWVDALAVVPQFIIYWGQYSIKIVLLIVTP